VDGKWLPVHEGTCDAQVMAGVNKRQTMRRSMERTAAKSAA